MSRLEGRVLVITGGTQGIGEAIALHVAREGAAGVVICGRQEEKGRGVVAKIEELGSTGEFVRADLASVDDCRNCGPDQSAERARARTGAGGGSKAVHPATATG